MTKNKTQDSQEQETVIDQTLVEKIDNVINELKWALERYNYKKIYF